jgi:hypothetical protein
MKEKDIQSIFGKKNKIHGVFELKLCKVPSLPFKSVAEHQVKALSEVQDSGLYHKIYDLPMFAGSKTRYNSKKPFDCFYLKNTPAFIVICWYAPRKYKTLHYIPIDNWKAEMCLSERKSITKKRSEEISVYQVEY